MELEVGESEVAEESWVAVGAEVTVTTGWGLVVGLAVLMARVEVAAEVVAVVADKSVRGVEVARETRAACLAMGLRGQARETKAV